MNRRCLLQINITANWGSHGKIAEAVGRLAIERGWESHIAYGRRAGESASQLYHIGSMRDEYIHGVMSRLTDSHGLHSKNATRQLIAYIRRVQPTIIHLHNIHGYYLNYPLLFRFLRTYGAPVVWTLHDCWSFTGHCAHYTFNGCDRWKTLCHHCPGLADYPKTVGLDRSRRNYLLKQQLFTDVPRLTLVTVSNWLNEQLSQSFLQEIPRQTIHNGIDIRVFDVLNDRKAVKAKWGIAQDTKVILGVASCWYRKGLSYFVELNKLLDDRTTIVLVGVDGKTARQLPANMMTVPRTESVNELVELYNMADVYYNPTQEDSFPTTNIEALACGTPVVTHRVGGSPESISDGCGCVLEERDMPEVWRTIRQLTASEDDTERRQRIRRQTVGRFDANVNYAKYLDLYQSLL